MPELAGFEEAYNFYNRFIAEVEEERKRVEKKYGDEFRRQYKRKKADLKQFRARFAYTETARRIAIKLGLK